MGAGRLEFPGKLGLELAVDLVNRLLKFIANFGSGVAHRSFTQARNLMKNKLYGSAARPAMPVIPTWLARSLLIKGSFSGDFVARSLDSLPAGRVYGCVPQPAGEPLMFKVGEKVVYPNHGVGLVEQV